MTPNPQNDLDLLIQLLEIKIERYDEVRWYLRSCNSSPMLTTPKPHSITDALAQLRETP